MISFTIPRVMRQASARKLNNSRDDPSARAFFAEWAAGLNCARFGDWPRMSAVRAVNSQLLRATKLAQMGQAMEDRKSVEQNVVIAQPERDGSPGCAILGFTDSSSASVRSYLVVIRASVARAFPDTAVC